MLSATDEARMWTEKRYTYRGMVSDIFAVRGVCIICGARTPEMTGRRPWPKPAKHCDDCKQTYSGAMSFATTMAGGMSILCSKGD